MSGCPCSGVPGVTSVIVRGNTIGLVGLCELFKTWSTENISSVHTEPNFGFIPLRSDFLFFSTAASI